MPTGRVELVVAAGVVVVDAPALPEVIGTGDTVTVIMSVTVV